MAKPERSKKSEDKDEREGSELIEKLVGINRVTKVVKGGKSFKMSAMVIIGDGKGRVGYGTGKAREVPEAISKATNAARRAMKRIPLREGRTLHHDVRGRYGAGKVLLKPASEGTGLIAGGAVRAVLEVAGVHNILTKCLGSHNPHNLVKATLEGLCQLKNPEEIAAHRGK